MDYCGSPSQIRDLWFTVPPQQSLLVSQFYLAIPISCLKFLFVQHSSFCAFFLNPFMHQLTQSNRPHRLVQHNQLTHSIITTWSVRSEEIRTGIMDTLNRVKWTKHTITLQLLQFVPIGYMPCTHACNCQMYIY